MIAIMVLAAGLLGIGAWLVQRRSHASAFAATAAVADTRLVCPPAAASTPAAVTLDAARLEAAKAQAAARLWKLAFAAPSQSQASLDIHRRVRDNIVAILQVDSLDPRYFPRRPALMPQLLHAVNDPHAASEKISRIIAHDPVLTADVLRLANSSLNRTSPTPIETIQRAIVVCGGDALRGMLATAMLRPVFRATRRNFPRLPRMLWERTERAARAAELYAMETNPQDRFEAQLVALLSALGPLVVYSAALDVYARNPHFSPSAALCVELIGAFAPEMSQRVARGWQTSSRLLAALEGSAEEPLTAALHVGEFFGTLAFLESQTVISRDARLDLIADAGMAGEPVNRIWAGLTGTA
ncbi:MAG: HDOD domain-containing protein [Steroidobacteraceae bacterium]